MVCKNVVPLLSEYFDEALDSSTAIRVSQHLDSCDSCRKEMESLVAVHNRLRTASGPGAPEFLRDLVELRLAEMHGNSWRNRLRDAIELRWSRIRTTEGTWYLTRALGTVTTVLFILFLSVGINPIYLEATPPEPDRVVLTSAASQKNVLQNLKANFGVRPAPVPNTQSRAAINALYFIYYAQSLPRVDSDDTFSVGIEVDPRGSAKIERVIERPADQSLLSSFAQMIASSRWRPAQKNGQAVTSQLVLIISKIIVYE